MATSRGNGTLPSVRFSSSQTSSSDSQTESAARCSAFRGQKRKLHNDEQLAKARSQPEYIQVSNSVDFKYSARGSAVCIGSATNTVRQTAQATRVYNSYTTSYLHYLERKIKVLNSKVDSFNNYTEGKIKLINSKISSYAHHLDREYQLVNDNKGVLADAVREIQRLKDEQDLYFHDIDTKIKLLQHSHANVMTEIEDLNASKDLETQNSEKIIKMRKDSTHLDAHELNRNIMNEIAEKYDFDRNINKEIEQLNAKKEAYAHDLDNQMKLLNANGLHGDDLDRQIKLQSGRIDLSTRNLDRRIQLMNARLDSYDGDLERRYGMLNDKVATCTHDIGSQLELLTSKTAPFARELEGQLQLLDSKFTLCKQNVTKQKVQLHSNIISYSRDVDEKIRLVNSDSTS